MDLILIRHPAVAVDAGICYGRTDVPLIDLPHASVVALSARLAALKAPPPDVVLTSPLTRCASVASEWAAQYGCDEPRADARLQEMDFGSWEQQRWDGIDRALLDAWAADLHHARSHGGESVAQLSTRVRGWLDEMHTPVEGACVHVMTHAGVIRVSTALALEMPLERCLRWPIDFVGIVWLRRNHTTQQWVLVRWNA